MRKNKKIHYLNCFVCKYAINCFECCKETEMIVTNEEVETIIKRGFKREEFIQEVDGFLELRNSNGVCVFLKEGKCKIYDIRPQGCKFYPLIYDVDKDCVVVDKDCPYHIEIRIKKHKKLFPEIKKYVQKLLREQKKREKKDN